MISGEFKSKIDKIWEVFWSGGISNPIEAIEQFTYLLFIKDLENIKSIFPEDKQYLKWSNFKHMEAEDMYRLVSMEVFPFIKEINRDRTSSYCRYMSDALFKVPTPQILSKVVHLIDNLYVEDTEIKGDLYEYMLSRLSVSGTNGQFRTPRHIIRLIINLMQPKPDDIIVDPAMGTAGFLVESEDYLKRKYRNFSPDPNMFNGFDIDETMLRIGAMNMILHGVKNPNIDYRNSLSKTNKDNRKYTLVMANPPFKGNLDYESVSSDLFKITRTKRTELLFLALFIRILKNGGRCASIVPNGVLFGSTKGHKNIRKEIIDNNRLEAVISMPSGVFRPYSGVSTAIIIFTKTTSGDTDKVWFYDMKSDGFSLDDRRTPVKENDIPDIIVRFNNMKGEMKRRRSDQSFFVPVDEIRENNYDLSINRYKAIEYEKVYYDDPEVILAKVQKIENKVEKEINKLEKMTKDIHF